MATINSLEELLIDELRDLYDAENQLVKALPKMAKAASNEKLKAGFTTHFEQTKSHVERLEQALKLLDESPKGKTCQAMKGLVQEGSEAIDLEAPSPIRDADLIGAAQRVEHYEIAAYGTARAFAERLGQAEIVELLQETLEEEGETNEKLTELSETVNKDAEAAAPVEHE
jgi:ferritin-like metal-binding protein YciE